MDDINFQDSFSDAESLVTPLQSNWLSDSNPISSTTNTTSAPIHIPIVRSGDKPSSSLPEIISMFEDFLCASVGFQCTDTLKQHFRELCLDSVKFDYIPADAILDSGDLATLQTRDRNITPVPRPLHFGDIMHMDIILGLRYLLVIYITVSFS